MSLFKTLFPQAKTLCYHHYHRPISLHFSCFTDTPSSQSSPEEIPKHGKLFVRHLYDRGYLNDLQFFAKNQCFDEDGGLDFSRFGNQHGRRFMSLTSEKFGKDNQEIAKWLSGDYLKKVALFGCPSTTKRSVLAAKRLRKFFGIQEATVCDNCVLNQSCKFVNKNVWKFDTKKLILTDVLDVIVPYALGSMPPELVVPDHLKASISRLVKEVVNKRGYELSELGSTWKAMEVVNDDEACDGDDEGTFWPI